MLKSKDTVYATETVETWLGYKQPIYSDAISIRAVERHSHAGIAVEADRPTIFVESLIE
jgi:hypothetical protein